MDDPLWIYYKTSFGQLAKYRVIGKTLYFESFHFIVH